MPVPDPFLTLPAPTVAADPTNVNPVLRGGVRVATLPLLTTTLLPGVYEWIEIVTGSVTFQPGVYVIRNKNPITNISLNILGGTITANGVMFYVTDTAAYSAISGSPDNSDGETAPAQTSPLNIVPSVVVNAAVALGSQFSPLNSTDSPFHEIFLYQRRQDYRPIVISHQTLLDGATLRGRLYSKWGHISFIGDGHYDLSFVAGTVRFVSALGMTIAPATLLDSAKDVYLVN
jgi:hypothetical protein